MVDPQVPDEPTSRIGSGTAVTALSVAAMAGAASTIVSIGALGPQLLPAFEIGRAELGAVLSVTTITGGLSSPAVGRLADRVGTRGAVTATFLMTAAAFTLFAVAPGYWMLLAGALMSGMALASSNPATNKMIAGHFPPGRRGRPTGIKQAGAHVATLAGGAGVPVAAALVGWRGALVGFALLAACAVLLTRSAVTDREAPSGAPGPIDAVARRVGRRIGLYALLIGLANSAIYFLPLYGVEVLRLRPALAGSVVSLLGCAAVAGRIVWAERVDVRRRGLAALRVAARGGVFAYGLVWLAGHWGGWWLLATGALLVGATLSSWGAIGMLVVLERVADRHSGVASGMVMSGFYLGLGAGTFVQGVLADAGRDYRFVWMFSAATSAAASLVVGERALERRNGPGAVGDRESRAA